MATQIPINPKLLVWARETAGYTVEAIESNYAKLSEWESGQSYPTYNQLEQLACKYHRPLAIFFFPSPPAEDVIEKSLRAISESEVSNLSPNLRHIFRKAKAFQLALQELNESSYNIQKEKVHWIQELPLEQDDTLLASAVRQKLGITLQDQRAWNDSDKALKAWRSILAVNGIYVFKEAFKTDKISGFCIYDDLFPVIFINNTNQTHNRQIFTLFHELGHLIYKDSYLDVTKDRRWKTSEKYTQDIEVKCNFFASQFLVPAADFNNNFKHYSSSDLTNEVLRIIADTYHVSREVVLRRFLDMKIIDPHFYNRKTAEWLELAVATKKKSEATKTAGGSYDNTKMSYLGDAYLSLVLKQYYNGFIGMEQASNYLDVPVKSLERIGDTFLERREA